MCLRRASSWAPTSSPSSQRSELHPGHECDLTPVDLASVVEAFGIAGFRADDAENRGAALDPALAQEGPAFDEADVDAYEPLLPAGRIEKYVRNLEKALMRARAIRHSSTDG